MQLCLELFEVSQDWLENFTDNLNQNAINFIPNKNYGIWIFKQKASNGLVRLKSIELKDSFYFDDGKHFISISIWRSGWSKSTPKFDKKTGYIRPQSGTSGSLSKEWLPEIIEQINKDYIFDSNKNYIREEDGEE